MSRYVLTPAADADRDEIWAYVTHQSGLERAMRLEDQLHETMHRLARHPGIGHFRGDLADEGSKPLVRRAPTPVDDRVRRSPHPKNLALP